MAKKPTKPPAEDPNLAVMKAILEKKKQARTQAEVDKPTDLTHKQPVRTKPFMRRRP